MKFERPRLVVRKSLRGVTIQVIKPDGTVVAGVWARKHDALKMAEKLAALAKKHRVKQVQFDRGKHRYHGLVKRVADAARKKGLEF